VTRLLRALLAGILLSSLFVAASASPAVAVIQTVQCLGTYEATYNPGMTFEQQEINSTTSSDYTCTSTDPTIEGTSTGVHATIDTSCLELLRLPSAGQTTLTWNTGETTVYRWNATGSHVDETTFVYVVGEVVAGKFLGARVFRVSASVPSELESQCRSSEGLTHVEGNATLTITKLL
jgi:hypothetical protein